MNYSEANLAAMNANKETALAILKGGSCVVIYRGSDGAGGIVETRFSDSSNATKACDLVARYFKTKGNYSLSKTQSNAESLVKTLCEQMIFYYGHGGYEIDDGGNGEMTIDGVLKTAELSHNERVISSENTTNTL